MFKTLKHLALLNFLILFCVSFAQAQLNFYFVDVGQGDATYIELPHGGNVLIDGGPSGKIIEAFLKNKGVTHIDHVVLTHPHSDHYAGLKKVFKTVTVSNFYDSRAENLSAKGDNTLREQAAMQPNCATHFPEAGTYLNFDKDVSVKVLSTCNELVQSRNNDVINNCSIVLRFYYNGTGVLFTGDIEAPIENAITRVFRSGLTSYAMKVPHHGSRYSSSPKFLERVQPKVAIISFGEGNKYGHPHAEALQRLQDIGAQIYYTLGQTQTLFIPAPSRTEEFSFPQVKPYDPTESAEFVFTTVPMSVSIPQITSDKTTITDSPVFNQLKQMAQ